MNSIEQILEEARMRILSRQIHNHDTLAAFFWSRVASSVSVNVEEFTEEAVCRGFYRHFGRLYISVLHVAIDLAKDAIDWRLLRNEGELLLFLKAAAGLFPDSYAPEKVLTSSRSMHGREDSPTSLPGESRMKAQFISDDASIPNVQLLFDREAAVIVSAALTFAGRFHPDYMALADRIESGLIEAHRGRMSVPESS